MARLPGYQFVIQQVNGQVILFEDRTEREIVRFDPQDADAAARAQKAIYDSVLSPEDKVFAHFWSGYFYAHSGGQGVPGSLLIRLPAGCSDEDAYELEKAVLELMKWRDANPGRDMAVIPRADLERLQARGAVPPGDPCPQCGEGELVPQKGKLVCHICQYVQGCCDPA